MKKILFFFISIIIVTCQTNNNPLNNDQADNSDLKTIVSGRVVDKISYPIYGIPGTKIIIKSISYFDSIFSDNNGRYSFENLLPDTYELEATKANYDTITNSINTKGVDSIRTDFELTPTYRYSDGIVLAGFIDTVKASSVFQLFDSMGLEIKSLKGFEYHSQLPADSIYYVRELLSSKSYLNVTAHTVFVYQGVIVNVSFFYDFDNADCQDWILTKKELHLYHVNSIAQDGVIKVPIGEELNWTLKLREFRIIRWLTLDYYIPIGF